MTDATVLDILQKAISLTFMICLPVLGFGMVVGLIVAIFQAATQIHEMTITFIPKMAAIGLSLIIFGPWMLNKIVGFTINILESIPTLVK